MTTSHIMATCRILDACTHTRCRAARSSPRGSRREGAAAGRVAVSRSVVSRGRRRAPAGTSAVPRRHPPERPCTASMPASVGGIVAHLLSCLGVVVGLVLIKVCMMKLRGQCPDCDTCFTLGPTVTLQLLLDPASLRRDVNQSLVSIAEVQPRAAPADPPPSHDAPFVVEGVVVAGGQPAATLGGIV
eukprot:COSAG02_NODE_554_length_20414_cov_67.356535_3_plen_187_part_00